MIFAPPWSSFVLVKWCNFSACTRVEIFKRHGREREREKKSIALEALRTFFSGIAESTARADRAEFTVTKRLLSVLVPFHLRGGAFELKNLMRSAPRLPLTKRTRSTHSNHNKANVFYAFFLSFLSTLSRRKLQRNIFFKTYVFFLIPRRKSLIRVTLYSNVKITSRFKSPGV